MPNLADHAALDYQLAPAQQPAAVVAERRGRRPLVMRIRAVIAVDAREPASGPLARLMLATAERAAADHGAPLTFASTGRRQPLRSFT